MLALYVLYILFMRYFILIWEYFWILEFTFFIKNSQNERFKSLAFERFKILEKETQNIIPDSHKSTGKKSYGLFSKSSNSAGDVTSTGYGI